jgi:hypothetical protein
MDLTYPSEKPMPSNPSEALAVRLLTSTLRRVFENVQVISGLVIPLPASARIETAEFDVLVVCDAGILAFEVKGWQQAYVVREITEDGKKQWFLSTQQGKTSVCDPLAQGIEKIAGLKAQIDSRVRVNSYVFLPEEGIELAPDMPAGVLCTSDLPYFSRMLRSKSRNRNYSNKLDKEAVTILAAQLLAMGAGQTQAGHIDNCQRLGERKRSRPAGDDALTTDALPK